MSLMVDAQDWLVIGPIAVAATAIGSFIAWIWARAGKSALMTQQVADARTHAQIADNRASAVQKAHDLLLERLHDHMLTDAASFARLEAIANEASRTAVAAEMRLTNSMDKLGVRLDTMTSRLDELLQQRVAAPA